ncbi:hypothetical protein EDD29_5999 [Actinocorallia herbida]|uniref:Tetratricopeptide repeat protein n=1 Tax=Actinocorallia herbida TaxID=58109 RepID=A0A3N1D473_9ACTN|nr:hypothetical protein EDD29_5999 [Actinocorallia herbida]
MAAAEAGDGKAVRRMSGFFVFRALVDEGIPYWERAAPVSSWAAFTLARYRKIRGDRAEAERLYRSFAGTSGDCAYGLGVLLGEDGDSEAQAWFRTGWEDWRRLDCKIELGKGIAAQGRPGEAAAFLMDGAGLGDIAVFRWVELFEAMQKTLDDAAASLDAAGSPAEAAGSILDLAGLRDSLSAYPGLLAPTEELYLRAADLSASDPYPHSYILLEHARTLYAAGGRADDCAALLHRAGDLGLHAASSALAGIAQDRGDLAEAERAYTAAAEAGEPDSVFNLALMYEAVFRLDDAEHWYRRYLDLFPDDPEVPGQLAHVARKRSIDATALRERVADLPRLRAAAEAGDARAGYLFGSSLWTWKQGSAREMLPWILPLAEEGDAEAADLVAELYGRLGKASLRDRRRLRAAELGDLNACRQAGLLSNHHKDWQQAERWFVRSASDGDGLDAFFAGKLMAQRESFAEAEPLLRHAWAQGEHEAYGPEAAGYYGVVLHRLGRSAEAVPLLEAAAESWSRIVLRHSDDVDVIARAPNVPELLKEARAAAGAG